VLHHTVDTERAVSEAHRVLKPDGEAIVMLYNRYSWFNLAARASGTPIEHPEKDAPIIRRFSTRGCRKLFERFRHVDLHVDRFPKRTLKFDNLLAKLNNNVLVPFFERIPQRVKRPFGWHIMIRARKQPDAHLRPPSSVVHTHLDRMGDGRWRERRPQQSAEGGR
jgi:SAM-dependent methyltransferase